MRQVPRAGDVDRALAAALREVTKCRDAVNKQAGVLVGRGRYDGAEALVRSGRAIADFQSRLDAFRREWRSIRSLADGDEHDGSALPLWRTFAPILQALITLGGTASRGELVEFLTASGPPLNTGQKSATSPDWKRVLGRAKRSLVQEGFLEANPSFWRITDSGRQAVRNEG
jgi:hypothetical protein